MDALKFHVTVKSDTLKIPELKRFIGKRIEVILLDDSKNVNMKENKFNKLKNLKGKIIFDKNALSELRQNSII